MSKEEDEELQAVFEEMTEEYRPPPLTYPEFLGIVLRVGMVGEEEIKECIEEEVGKPCNGCGKATHEVCDGGGEPLCDDCAITSEDSEFVAEGDRYCHNCFHKLGY